MLARLRSAAVTLLALTFPAHGMAAPANGCEVGTWVVPGMEERLDHAAIVTKAATAPVVLLGEAHDDPEHHRWQLSVVAGLLGQRRDIVLGLPRALPHNGRNSFMVFEDGEVTDRGVWPAGKNPLRQPLG